MSKKNNGGPAFPHILNASLEKETLDLKLQIDTGMTKREYFAVRMMQGIISNSEVERANIETTDPDYFKKISVLSVELADELLEALNE